LAHPQSIGLVRDSTDLHFPRRDVHEEEHHKSPQTRTRPGLHGEKISSDDLIPMALQEFFQRCLLDAFRGRCDAMALQYVHNCSSSDATSKVRQCTLDRK